MYKKIDARARKHRRSVAEPKESRWLFSPLTTALIAGAVGLLGTAWAGYFNLQIERQKQEGSMILEAIKTGDTKAAARNLLFFSDASLIRLSPAQIERLRAEGGDSGLPVLPRPNSLPDKINFTPTAALTNEIRNKLSEDLAQFQKYSGNVGFKMSNDKVNVTVASGNNSCEGFIAVYYGDSKTICVASEFAGDTTVILREYTHHLLNNTNKIIDGRKYSAIESGLASYFSCSFSERPRIGDKSEAALKGQFPYHNLENRRNFDEIALDDSNSVQNAGSEIWGAAFWEIRNVLQKEAADKLLFDTWNDLKPVDDGGDPYVYFANTLIDTYKAGGDGSHLAEIQDVFRKRGLNLR